MLGLKAVYCIQVLPRNSKYDKPDKVSHARIIDPMYKHNCNTIHVPMQSHADSIVKHTHNCIARRITLKISLYTTVRDYLNFTYYISSRFWLLTF